MANYRYDHTMVVPYFSGMNQTGDGYNTDMKFSVEMENVDVTGGTYRVMRMGRKLPNELPASIGTLAYLHRRFGQETGTLLVAISDGKVYTKELDNDDEWELQYVIPEDPEGEEDLGEEPPMDIDRYSWVTYEVNIRGDEPLDDPVDVLLFSNAYRGMFCLYGDTKEVDRIETPEKFGVIARYNERIWGTGVLDQPDLLVYSAPYDPFTWTVEQEEEEPEEPEEEETEPAESASEEEGEEEEEEEEPEESEVQPEDMPGDIRIPTWDGDSFQTLVQYGSELLAIKRNSIWRIYGTNPGEFVVHQQYGGGTIVGDSVQVYGEAAYMLGQYGVMRYDGTGAYPYLQEQIHNLMNNRVNHAVLLETACAGLHNGVYCLALPIDQSEYCNAILEYNIREKTVSLRTGAAVDSFMQLDERLFYASVESFGRVYELNDSYGVPLPSVWISGWQDAGVKQSIKSAFILYLMVESESPVELRVALRTEKKQKQKIITTKPGKMSRLHLNTHGRIFRLEIRSYSAVPFTIAGGMRLDMELDPD